MEASSNGVIPVVTDPASYPGWKQPEVHTLPSGAVFLLRKPQLRKMMQRGLIPNPLMDTINAIFKERDQLELTTEAEAKGVTVEELAEQRRQEAEADAADPSKPPPIPRLEDDVTPEMAFGFRDVIVWAAIVEPKVEMEPAVNGPLTASGALSYDALDEDDVTYIMNFANKDVDEVAPFPADGERQDPGPDGGTVLEPPEPVAGHPA